MFYSCILKSAKVASCSVESNAQQQLHVPVYDAHDFIDLSPLFYFFQNDEIVFNMETITFLMIISVLFCMFPVSAAFILKQGNWKCLEHSGYGHICTYPHM